jgi:hypothetical protein
VKRVLSEALPGCNVTPIDIRRIIPTAGTYIIFN